MRSKLYIFLTVFSAVFLCSVPAYGVTKEGFASGLSVFMKIGITLLVSMLLLITLIFIYGMVRSYIKEFKEKKAGKSESNDE